jgi:hypothetical protein
MITFDRRGLLVDESPASLVYNSWYSFMHSFSGPIEKNKEEKQDHKSGLSINKTCQSFLSGVFCITRVARTNS